MANQNRVCLTCGEKYSYCSNCNKKDPVWMVEFHDSNCKEIFETCTRYNMQLLTKEEAKAILEKCDLSNKANFKACVQRDLDVIFAEEPKPKRGKRIEINPIDEMAIEIHEVVNKTEE